MQRFEYKVVPAPSRGEKARGARTGADRFAHALTQAINAMARDGWEYLRAETLPAEERSGFTGRTTVYHNILVFARPLDAAPAIPVAVPDAAAQIPLLSTDAPFGPAPRITLADAGAAPKLGPADKDVAAE